MADKTPEAPKETIVEPLVAESDTTAASEPVIPDTTKATTRGAAGTEADLELKDVEVDDAPSASGSEKSGSLEKAGLMLRLEAETGSEYARSVTSSSSSSIATSLSESATEFRHEHGRRYHAYSDAAYQLPNDEQEMSRLELQHLIWNLVFNGRLALAPISDSMTDALDIGTGTGAWAIEFANAYPHINIIGTDLSPIQPAYIPVNCSFLIDDANNTWPSSFAGKFDYIHTRALGMGVRNWDAFIDQAWKALKPGGWLELQEFHFPLSCDDGSLKEDGALAEWSRTMLAAGARVGVDASAALKHAQRMRDRGFVGVKEAKLKGPIGPWAKGRREKEIGVLALKDLAENLVGISLKLFTIVGHTSESAIELCDRAKIEMMNPKVHTYMPIDLQWGQKPGDNPIETPSE